jgi:hypothetical protein
MDDNDCGAVSKMIGSGNQSTLWKPAQVPLCPLQILHDLTLVTMVGRQWLTTLDTAQPITYVKYRLLRRHIRADVKGTGNNQVLRLCASNFNACAETLPNYIWVMSRHYTFGIWTCHTWLRTAFFKYQYCYTIQAQFQVMQDFSLLYNVQNDNAAHPASYPVGAGGSFPRWKAARSWSHLYLAPWSRKMELYPHSPCLQGTVLD